MSINDHTGLNSLDVERDKHDQWAKEEARSVTGDFSHFTALENRWIINRLGSLKGAKVLDIGCGLGEATFFFSSQGAEVTAVDISPEMINHCEMALKSHGYDAISQVSSAEEFEVEWGSYDIVYCANLLHHVYEKDQVIKRVARALKPGGRAYFIDPLKYNPFIWVYRLLASNVRTPGERPVGFNLVKEMKAHFKRVEYKTTWLLTQSLFIKYLLVDWLHPGKTRYWKKMLNEKEETTGRWFNKLAAVDESLCKAIPFLKYFAWNIVIETKNPRGELGEAR